MMRHPGEPLDAALLLVVLRTHRDLCRAPTWAEMLAATGLRSSQTIHKRLGHLRDAGLVTWAPRTRGTLRPTCVEVGVQLAAPELVSP